MFHKHYRGIWREPVFPHAGDETDGLSRNHLEDEINNLQEQVSHLQQEKEHLEKEIIHLKEEKCQKENPDLSQLVNCGHVTADNKPQRPNSAGNRCWISCGNYPKN